MFGYLKDIMLLRSVEQAYVAEKGTGKPLYLSRRFIGAVLAAVAGVYAIHKGINVDADSINTMTDSLIAVISGLIAIYGIVLHIVGQFRKGVPDGQVDGRRAQGSVSNGGVPAAPGQSGGDPGQGNASNSGGG